MTSTKKEDYISLRAQLQAVKGELLERKRKRSQVIDEIRRLMEEYCLSITDIAERSVNVGRRQQTASSANRTLIASSPALFMDPATGRTWSGRGRRPRWLVGNTHRFRVTGF